VITFSIDGTVTERPSGAPLPGLFVKAFDKDLLFDDLLGSDVSNARGRFRIVTELRDFTDILDKRPDLYFRVYRSDRRTLVHTTERAVRWSATVLGRRDSDSVGEPTRSRCSDACRRGSRRRRSSASTATAWTPTSSKRPVST
jgi:hypothetical protein